MAGTNDILAGDSANTALAKLDTLVGRIRAALPNTHILVASLIPNTSTTVTQAVTAEFSRRVAGEVVNPRATAGQKVSFVDIFNTPGLLPSDFQTDGIHLTTSGYNKISSVWQAGILNLNDGQDTLRNIENVTGSDFNDTLTGNTGANVLVGLGGNDILRGGGGSDTLTGGVGSDIFVLETDAATDIFTDFSLDQGDLIGLSGSVQFADLSFAGSNILQGGQTLATLLGFDTTTLTVNNFTQMA